MQLGREGGVPEHAAHLRWAEAAVHGLELLWCQHDLGGCCIAFQVLEASGAKHGDDSRRLVQQPSDRQLAGGAALLLRKLLHPLYQGHVLHITCPHQSRCTGAPWHALAFMLRPPLTQCSYTGLSADDCCTT